MIKKKKKHFNFSIQMIVFGILIITILPMNLLYIHAARQSVKALNVQAETSVQNLLALIGTDISERITQTNQYMGEVVSNNAYYTALPQQESWDEYQLNKFFLGQNLIDNTTVSTAADTYFVFSKTKADYLIARPGRLANQLSYESLKNFITEYVSNNKASSWHLIWIDEKPFLMCCHYAKETYFGGLIELSNQKKILLKGLTYESARVFLKKIPKAEVRERKQRKYFRIKILYVFPNKSRFAQSFLWYVRFRKRMLSRTWLSSRDTVIPLHLDI